MTVYNKLKIAILAIFSSQHLYAITLDPLQIQSAPGELLYAEMSFHQANNNDKIEVSLASPEDLMMIGAAHQPPANLNFYIRHNNRGEGTIVITSSRPMTDAELNIILKIQEGNATHLKHIKQSVRQNTKAPAQPTLARSSNEKSLTPKFVVSEKDIALNLPESARFSSPVTATYQAGKLRQENVLNISAAAPPAMNTAPAKAIMVTPPPSVTPTPTKVAPVNITPTTVIAQSQSGIATTQPTPAQTTTTTPSIPVAKPVPNPAPVIQAAPTVVVQAPPTPVSMTIENTPTPPKAVQNAELASNSKELKVEPQSKPQDSKRPEPEKEPKVKAPLQTKNTSPAKKAASPQVAAVQQHVVQRNESLWSIAQQISARTQQPVTQVMNQIKKQNEHAFVAGNANRLRQGVRLNFSLNTVPSRPDQAINQLAAKTTTPASGKVKYRLPQAEMSLVAESNQDSSTGTAKKDTLQQKTNADLSLKVMTAREKTVTLQRNVTQLELTLSQKEQRIQLLNARLAELQNQLKAQQEMRNPAH